MMKLSGVLTTGLGEGAFFMSMGHYRNEIRQKLGFDAYPGTLNIKTNGKVSFGGLSKIRIEGYTSNEKKFGGAICYRAKLKNIEGAIIVPDLTKHDKKIIEFIAPVYLRSELKLEDGDEITIELLK